MQQFVKDGPLNSGQVRQHVPVQIEDGAVHGGADAVVLCHARQVADGGVEYPDLGPVGKLAQMFLGFFGYSVIWKPLADRYKD